MEVIQFEGIKDSGEVVELHIPSSKSISHRILIIKALSENTLEIKNLSTADDTRLLEANIPLTPFKGGIASQNLFLKNAGTPLRFLLAFYSYKWNDNSPNEITFSADERMYERPMKDLIQALQQLGASFEFLGAENSLPLKLHPAAEFKSVVDINASLSSQFLSALLLIAPSLPNGLIINVKGEIASQSYIKMTLDLMALFGIKIDRSDNIFIILPQKYSYLSDTYLVETDYSSAGYIFAWICLLKKENAKIPNLKKSGLQGDEKLVSYLYDFGLSVDYSDNGALLSYLPDQDTARTFIQNMENEPDAIPTIVCFCVAKGILFEISGIHTLKNKESDRGEVLRSEFAKLNIDIIVENDTIRYDGNRKIDHEIDILLNTYNDHRMAMSFSLLWMICPKIKLDNLNCVEKSYPTFWSDLERMGVANR